MSGYILGVDADRDLEEIWEYIAQDNIDAADRWITKVFDAFESLGESPGIGHSRTDLYHISSPILASGRLSHHLSRTTQDSVLFQRVSRMGRMWGDRITPKAIWHVVKAARQSGPAL